jgi:glycosyltransferase involved in cell wall biosynthesis
VAESAGLRAWLPDPLRAFLGRTRASARQLLRLPGAWRRGLSARAGGGHPIVSFGFEPIPRRGQLIHGGMAKLQPLQDRHPNTPAGFNLLYLVSSAVPANAHGLVWAARRRGARLVWNQNGVAWPGWQPVHWKTMNVPMAALLKQADHVFYQSAFCKRAADEFLGAPIGTWEVLHNPVDTTAFHPDARAARSRLVLLLAGTQLTEYRVRIALETLAQLVRDVDAELIVTGRLTWSSEHAARAAAAGHVRRLGLERRVEFIGPYSQEDAPSIYRRADLLLHTQYNDASPGVVVEALSCGLPVVYSATGGVPELVGPSAGIGIPGPDDWTREHPPDPEALGAAVRRVAADRATYAEAARRRAVEAFDVRRWLARHDDVFTRLTASGS